MLTQGEIMRTTMAVLAILLLPAACLAQTDRTALSLAGGLAIPTAPASFSEQTDLGWSVAGALELPAFAGLAFQARASYDSFDPDQDFDDGGFGGVLPGGAVAGSAFSLFGNLKARWRGRTGPATPYVLGGAGLMRFSGENAGSDNVLGANVGAGVNIAVPTADLFIEADYVIGFTETENIQYLPVRVGVLFPL